MRKAILKVRSQNPHIRLLDHGPMIARNNDELKFGCRHLSPTLAYPFSKVYLFIGKKQCDRTSVRFRFIICLQPSNPLPGGKTLPANLGDGIALILILTGGGQNWPKWWLPPREASYEAYQASRQGSYDSGGETRVAIPKSPTAPRLLPAHAVAVRLQRLLFQLLNGRSDSMVPGLDAANFPDIHSR